MEIPLFKDIVVICGLAIIVVFVCQRFRVPNIVGFLLTGVLAGPHCLGLIKNLSDVEELAEIGVVCLLFTIGIEFSLRNLIRIRSLVVIGGTVQVGLTIATGALLAYVVGLPGNMSIFFGFLLSLSSTAIVLKILQQRSESESPHGKLSLGILIFQDVIVVVMILVSPILAGKSSSIGMDLLDLAIKTISILLVVFVAANWLAPSFFYQLARLRNQQLFLLGIVLVALGATWLTSAFGLSLALGAFIAGLIVSESDFSERALGNILPFRDLFTSFFFVSIGMLLNISYVLQNAFLVFTAALIVMTVKFLAAGSAAIILGFPARTAVLTGIALCQVGEFAFVLSETGSVLDLIDKDSYQLFLGLSVITMIVTPFLIASGESLASVFLSIPLPKVIRNGFSMRGSIEPVPKQSNHLIIVGFGIGGRNLSQVASAAKIPHVIIELNPDTVRKEKSLGLPINYGDASTAPVLEHADVKLARALVIMISDPAANRRIIETARRINPTLYIMVRTRFVADIDYLYSLGANEVVTEEYESSIEILARVLRKYLVPQSDIEKFITQVRSNHYQVFRRPVYESPTVSDLGLELSETEITSIRIDPGFPSAGKTIRELDIRGKFGVTILAIRRETKLISNPSPDEQIQDDDVLIIIGDSTKLACLNDLFSCSIS
ncbi:MAG: cation:proton antiporter [Pseudomonadota bacterium]